MLDLQEIIAGCKKMDKNCQRRLYEAFAPIFMGIACRYCRSRECAEDVLQEAFVKILMHIDQYTGAGSFEGWMRRVLINTAITHYRNNLKHDLDRNFDEVPELADDDLTPDAADFTRDELLKCIDKMPDGFRVIFNLYAIEGYKHREIAQMLDIAEGTSKSQYSRAKAYLQKLLNDLQNET